MGLIILVFGLIAFLGAHLFVTCRTQRSAVIARIGERPYKGIMALISLIGIILIGYGFAKYRAAGYIVVWEPPSWTRHVTVALLWPAIVCVVASYSRGNIWRRLSIPCWSA